jgi:hypothetical protein
MRVREALKKHLLSDKTKSPRIIPLATGDPEGMAIVLIDRMRGRVSLAGPDGDVSLLLAGAHDVSRFALPPGPYRLRDTRVTEEKDGVWWFLSSSTGPRRKPVDLQAGTTTKFDPGREVVFKGSVRPNATGLFLAFGVATADQRGLSVFRDGKRITISYQLLAADGGVLSEGPLEYG